jgi:hypothetical protein
MDNYTRNSKVTALLAERPTPLCTVTSLVCLNFKVPLRVRQQFKICAARNNMTMTELLLQLLDDYPIADADLSTARNATKPNKEI